MTKVRFRSETYLVTKELGQSKTDLSYDLYEVKKENGRKRMTVKVDRFNGHCLEVK